MSTEVQSATPAQPLFLREADVLAMLKVSDSTLLRMCKRGTFPKPYKLGSKIRAWRVTDVTAWAQGLKPAA